MFTAMGARAEGMDIPTCNCALETQGLAQIPT